MNKFILYNTNQPYLSFDDEFNPREESAGINQRLRD